MNNKGLTDRAQKTSLYSWFGGSLCTIVLELYEVAGERYECAAASSGRCAPSCWTASRWQVDPAPASRRLLKRGPLLAAA